MPLILAGAGVDGPLDRAAIYRAKTGKSNPLHDAVEAHVPLNQPPPERAPVEEVV